MSGELPVQTGLSVTRAGAARETIGARNKTAPTGALTPNAGALPTVKESTDG